MANEGKNLEATAAQLSTKFQEIELKLTELMSEKEDGQNELSRVREELRRVDE